MPGVLPGGDSWWAYQQAQQSNLLRGLLTQQQDTISNLDGLPVLNFGLIPGSNPAAYGLQAVNPATGGQLMFVGEDGSGNTYQAFYNSSGVKVSQWDVNGLHFYDTSGNEVTRLDSTGFHAYNASSTEEVRVGLLNASPAIYGLGVLPAAGGSLQQIDGFISATVTTLLTITGGGLTWQDIGGPSVTATIGPSGKALCTISAGCQYGTAAQLQAGVGIDGSTSPQTAPLINETTGTTGQVITMSSTAVISGLSAGSHTFKMIYYAQSNAFSNSTIAVAPL